MAQPTETELLILNSIIYGSSFSQYFTSKTEKSVYDWAVQFDKKLIHKMIV